MEDFHQLRIKFLTEREEGFVLFGFTLLFHIVFFNFEAIDDSNLLTATTELAFGVLMAFVLGKYFFRKEQNENKNELISIYKSLDRLLVSVEKGICNYINQKFPLKSDTIRQQREKLRVTALSLNLIKKEQLDKIIEFSKNNLPKDLMCSSLLEGASRDIIRAISDGNHFEYQQMIMMLTNVNAKIFLVRNMITDRILFLEKNHN